MPMEDEQDPNESMLEDILQILQVIADRYCRISFDLIRLMMDRIEEMKIKYSFVLYSSMNPLYFRVFQKNSLEIEHDGSVRRMNHDELKKIWYLIMTWFLDLSFAVNEHQPKE